MKTKIFVATALLLLVSPVFAVTAYYTGNSKRVKTVTGKMALECEYKLPDRKLIYKIFEYSCAAKIKAVIDLTFSSPSPVS